VSWLKQLDADPTTWKLEFNPRIVRVKNRDISVGIAAILRAKRSGVRIPLRKMTFSVPQNTWKTSGAHTASYSVGKGECFWR
jgi:hypothetical protein